MKCTLKFGHADQKEKIKTLNSVIKENKDKKSVLDAEIDILNQKYKECQNELHHSEEFFHISTTKEELKCLKKERTKLIEEAKKVMPKPKGKTRNTKGNAKNVPKNAKIDKLDQQIKKLQDQLKTYSKSDGITALKNTEDAILNEKRLVKEKIKKVMDEMEPKLKEKDARELDQLVKSVNMHHHTKSCRKYGNDCR